MQYKNPVEKILSYKLFWFITALILSISSDYPAAGLIIGIAIALIFGNPLKNVTGRISKKLLQTSVILLGFGMQIGVILKVGFASIGITFTSILITMVTGLLLGRFFKIERNLSILLTSGTAICGGSAIAAMAPAINATQGQTAVAMAVVFLLNALGLIIFPPLGHLFGMDEASFGLWSAIAIHDTSSVVGAAAQYGTIAAGIAITVKLTRALWIFPLAMGAARFNKSETKPPFPWFLIGFLLAGVITTFIPSGMDIWQSLSKAGKHLMTGTLFLVGAGLTASELSKVGVRSLIVSVILWIIITVVSFFAIFSGIWYISPDVLN